MWISRKQFDAMRAAADALNAAQEELRKRAYLIGIERNGRENTFTFMRGEEVHQIATMGLISDDLPGWKEKLLR